VPPSEAYHVRLFFRPHGAVGGDWFDVEAGAGGDVWVLVADVSGKGRPANLLASGLPHLWRTERVREGRRRGLPPGEVLALLGSELEACLPDCVFVEATLGRFTPAGRATVASAGACPVVLRRGRVEVHKLGGPPLGLADVRAPRGEGSWDLRPGDECLLATDGLFDQRAGAAGRERLAGRLPALLDEGGAASLHDAVADGLRRAVEAHGQDDDIAVVTVAFRAPAADAREGRDVPV
jgi:serine phosphatase RsbU (regulator of sigma subunit)